MAESAAALPTTPHVCVGDHESDMVELMLCARNLGYPVDYLIRSRHNRALPESGKKLWDQVQGAPNYWAAYVSSYLAGAGEKRAR